MREVERLILYIFIWTSPPSLCQGTSLTKPLQPTNICSSVQLVETFTYEESCGKQIFFFFVNQLWSFMICCLSSQKPRSSDGQLGQHGWDNIGQCYISKRHSHQVWHWQWRMKSVIVFKKKGKKERKVDILRVIFFFYNLSFPCAHLQYCKWKFLESMAVLRSCYKDMLTIGLSWCSMWL